MTVGEGGAGPSNCEGGSENEKVGDKLKAASNGKGSNGGLPGRTCVDDGSSDGDLTESVVLEAEIVASVVLRARDRI